MLPAQDLIGPREELLETGQERTVPRLAGRMGPGEFPNTWGHGPPDRWFIDRQFIHRRLVFRPA